MARLGLTRAGGEGQLLEVNLPYRGRGQIGSR